MCGRMMRRSRRGLLRWRGGPPWPGGDGVYRAALGAWWRQRASAVPPILRADGTCPCTARPCPWLGCRRHLAAEVTPGGRLRLLHPETPAAELPYTCALDAAADGARTTGRVARLAGLSRAGALRVLRRALLRLAAGLPAGVSVRDALASLRGW